MADPLPPAKPTSIKVRALARGYFDGQIREPGDEFDIEGSSDLGGWMMPINKADQVKLAAQLDKYAKIGIKPAPAGTRATPAMRVK
jgi:hypothetical protein